VLASVDEKTYTPATDLKMGDHPVIWTNEHVKARNIYIFMGHRPEHFDNKSFTQIFTNSIFWAAGQQESRGK
jgi:type 1 glutamine amidotransferase